MRFSLFVLGLFAFTGCQDYALSGYSDPNDLPPEGAPTPVEPLELGGVRGRVCAPNGESWVSGAFVRAVFPGGIAETYSDGDGWFLIDGLPAGTVDLTITKGSFSVTLAAEIREGQIAELPQQECLQQGDARIAVLSGTYDSIEEVLAHLDLEYDLYDGQTPGSPETFLRDPYLMLEYDIIFFNCGMNDSWMNHELEVAGNLNWFVEYGGSVYASDWAYYLVETTFSEHQAFRGDDDQPGSAFVGADGIITANVIDPGMRELLGSETAEINYDLGGWAALESAAVGEVLIEGSYPYFINDYTAVTTGSGPLATRFDHGTGQVLYTTFHNEQQTTFDMDLLLQDIVLSL